MFRGRHRKMSLELLAAEFEEDYAERGKAEIERPAVLKPRDRLGLDAAEIPGV
jgi:hypothetical protein